MNQHVNLTFSLKYLVNFSKSSSLSNVVQLMMSNDVPLLVSEIQSRILCHLNQSSIRYHSSLAKGSFASTSHPKSATISRFPFRTVLFITFQLIWVHSDEVPSYVRRDALADKETASLHATFAFLHELSAMMFCTYCSSSD